MVAEALGNHPLGKTAQVVAACRATEAFKPEKMQRFYDPWAMYFAGIAGIEMLGTIRKFFNATATSLEGYVIERTLFLDEALKDALAQPDMRQVVIAAVGGDGRPYRLDFPQGTVLYEMDFPEVMRYRSTIFKESHAQARCDLRSVPVDLSKSGWHHALVEAGFNPLKPSVWIVEGLLMYLTTEQCESFVSKIATLCHPGSSLHGDLFTKEFAMDDRMGDLLKLWLDCGATEPNYYIEEPKKWFSKVGLKAHIWKSFNFGCGCGNGERQLDVYDGDRQHTSNTPLLFTATK